MATKISHLKNSISFALTTLIFIFCSVSQKTEKSSDTVENNKADLPTKKEVISTPGFEKPQQSLCQIVEAESINLTQYQIDIDKSRTYIRLTDSTGIAQCNFSLPSVYYDIDVCYLSESAGQNTYAMYIANNKIVAWLGKDRDDQWHLLSEQKWHAHHNIAINNGDEIRIEALSETGSLVIFDYIKFTASTGLSSPPAPSATAMKKISRQAPTSTDMTTSQKDLVIIYPEEYEKAIKNPLKGFRISTPYPPEYDQ